MIFKEKISKEEEEEEEKESHLAEALPPFFKVLVTGVVASGLLGEVGEHGGKGFPGNVE